MRICEEYVYTNRKYEFDTNEERLKGIEFLKLIGFYPIGTPHRNKNNVITQEFIRKEYVN